MMAGGWQFYALGSAFFAGLTAILGKIGVSGVNSNLATLIRTVVVVALAAVIVTIRSEWQRTEGITSRTLLFLILSGVATGLSWICYYRVLQLGPASTVAPVDKLSVAFVIVLPIVILGEKLSWQTLMGGGLIVIGSVILAIS